jgi:hypothetical protein
LVASSGKGIDDDDDDDEDNDDDDDDDDDDGACLRLPARAGRKRLRAPPRRAYLWGGMCASGERARERDSTVSYTEIR